MTPIVKDVELNNYFKRMRTTSGPHPGRLPNGQRRRYLSARRLKADDKEYLKKTLRYLPGEWIIVTLDSGRIVDCSEEFSRLTGIAREVIVHSAISDFNFGGSEQGWGLKRLDMDLLQHGGRYEDVGLTTPDNVSMVVDIWVNHISGQWGRQALCLITDKSNQRQLQGELISKHQELKRAFSTLEAQAKELEAARNELRQKNRNISDLSAQSRETAALAIIGEISAELTHHLNNPLAAATGACRKLTRLHESNRHEQFGPMLILLNSALNRLKETIDEVHVIYKQSRTPATPKTALNINEQFDAIFALLEQRLKGRTVNRDIPEGLPEIAGRQSQFQHVIINLMDNAIDASGPNGTVAVSAKLQGDYVAISVSDDGPGIPEYEREKIFEAFYSLKEKGSGLGLAAVKRYVERDNATIEVGESAYGGARFTISYAIHSDHGLERKMTDEPTT